MRDHGGNLDEAIAAFGGRAEDWLDLSTGINRSPYPVPEIAMGTWQALPMRTASDALIDAARRAYETDAAVLPVAGAQAAIQLIPRLRTPAHVAVLGPTYNEHAGAFATFGWSVSEVENLDGVSDAAAAVVVNPNNPDGRIFEPNALLERTRHIPLVVVDESFADTCLECSLAPHAGQRGLIVLRSFGKFFGLAGLRLGFAIGHGDDIAALAQLAGPWAVSGPAPNVSCI